MPEIGDYFLRAVEVIMDGLVVGGDAAPLPGGRDGMVITVCHCRFLKIDVHGRSSR
jgi:hypothetical protein